MSAKQIKDLVRGLNPIMGTYSYLGDKKIKFWRVDCLSQNDVMEKFPELEEYLYKMKEIIPGTVLF